VSVLINADVGEEQGSDEELMPIIDMANIACGAHAGNIEVMQHTLDLANSHRVTVGAHVSYPDREGFGRRSIVMSPQLLSKSIGDQISTLEEVAKAQNIPISYVKPHGALYNDMMRDEEIFSVVLEAIAFRQSPLAFMFQTTLDWDKLGELCIDRNVQPIFEAFADRRYEDSGLLMPRSKPEACLDPTEALAQVKSIISDQCIVTASGHKLSVPIQTLCVHGDNPEAVDLAKDIHALLDQA
jgi:5-oxoprolinase (ATP-hydrolysing) subunit A